MLRQFDIDTIRILCANQDKVTLDVHTIMELLNTWEDMRELETPNND